MNRIDRLHAILTVLQSKRVVRAEDLATRFNISVRTVYRDLKSLEESGVPIGAEAGVGYFLIEGYHLPPVMFTHDEARSLLLAGMFLDKHSDAVTRAHFQNALTKVRAILDTAKQDDLDGLEQKIMVLPSVGKPETEDLRLSSIKQALSANQVLEIAYETIEGKSSSNRKIEPIGLCYYGNYWHLIAWCRLRNDFRDFRLDRIEELNVLPERFIRLKHPSLKEYLDKMYTQQALVQIVVFINSNMLPYIQNSKYSMGLVEETKKEEGTIMTFASYSVEHFSRWILMLGTSFDIISPDTLKSKIQNHVEELHGKYKG